MNSVPDFIVRSFYGDLDREIDRFFDHFQRQKRPVVQFGSRAWQPRVDLFETTDMVVAVVELAGVLEEQVDLVVQSKALVVRGQRGDPSEHRPHSYHLLEIASGAFERVVPLPAGVDPENTTAALRNGLLEVCMPKSRPRAITITIAIEDEHGD